jgi:hypothetical protein
MVALFPTWSWLGSAERSEAHPSPGTSTMFPNAFRGLGSAKRSCGQVDCNKVFQLADACTAGSAHTRREPSLGPADG